MDEFGFNIITRPEWGARMAKGFETVDYPSMKYVCLFYNTETEKCTTRDECCKTVNLLQEHHQKLGLSDIHFNFLIGGDGMVYEGRGWHRRPSKCVRHHEYDEMNFAIAYIGDWNKMPVPPVMQTSFLTLVRLGVRRTMIPEDHQVVTEMDGIPLIGGFKRKKSFRRKHRGAHGLGVGLTMAVHRLRHRKTFV